MSQRWIVACISCVVAINAPLRGANDEKQRWADICTLRENKIARTPPALFEFLGRQIARPVPPARLDALIRRLGSDSFDEREEASDELAAIGQSALPRLRAALLHRDPEVRKRAGKCVEALEAEAALVPAAVRVLVRMQVGNTMRGLLRLPSARFRLLALQEAEKIGLTGRKARQAVADAMADQDEAVRRLARELFGQALRPEEDLRVVIALAAGERVEAKVGAMYCMYRFQEASERVVPAMVKALKDKDVRVRRAAAQALRNHGDVPAAVVALEAALDDPDATTDPTEISVSAGAADSLGDIGKPARRSIPRLAKALREGQASLRIAAARGMGQLGFRDHESVKVLLPHLIKSLRADPDPGARSSAAGAIGNFKKYGAPAVEALILSIRGETSKESWQVRATVIGTLELIGPMAAKAVPDLFAIAEDTTCRAGDRHNAVIALGHIGGKGTAERLKKLAAKKEPSLQFALDRALSRLAP